MGKVTRGAFKNSQLYGTHFGDTLIPVLRDYDREHRPLLIFGTMQGPPVSKTIRIDTGLESHILYAIVLNNIYSFYAFLSIINVFFRFFRCNHLIHFFCPPDPFFYVVF